MAFTTHEFIVWTQGRIGNNGAHTRKIIALQAENDKLNMAVAVLAIKINQLNERLDKLEAQPVKQRKTKNSEPNALAS